MTLIETVRTWVMRYLPHDDADPKVVAALNAMSPRALLVLYLNWRDRLIAAGPRRAVTSPAFDRNPIVRREASTIAEILDDIEQGRDLTKYLSRRVKIGFDLPSKPGPRNLRKVKHLDLLLNDWGIHHLHISTTVEADGFVKNGDPLIFGIFRADRAYLIDVMTHKDFAEDRLVRTVVETWPGDNLAGELKGMMGSGRTYTKQERTQLRSAGLTSAVDIDGRLFVPGAGISSAGTSARASIFSGRIVRALKQFEEQVKADPAPLIKQLRRHGGHPADEPKFEFTFFQEGIGVIETTSGCAIGLRA